MDTRRDPRSRESRQGADGRPPVDDLTDTGLVKLVDLHTVGPSGWSGKPVAILVVAVVGILAVAGAAIALRPSAHTSTAPAVGIASPSPVASPLAPTLAPSQSRAPSPTVRPTPRPSATPTWAWLRQDLLPWLDLRPRGIWGVGDQVLVLADQFDTASDEWQATTFARLERGQPWLPIPAPPAIVELTGGTVIDDNLWFIARVAGVTEEHTTWELVRTTTGDDWYSAGTSEGLVPVDGVEFIHRVGDRWVAGIWRYRSDAGDGAITMGLRSSEDGVRWDVVELPEIAEGAIVSRAAMRGDTMVVIALKETSRGYLHVVLTSSDGINWHETPSPLPSDYDPTGLACNDAVCVVPAYPTGADMTIPVTIRTTDFESWAIDELDAPDTELGGHFSYITAVPGRGFIAMGQDTGYAFVADGDGLGWSSVQVMAPSDTEVLRGLAVSGEVVVALTEAAPASRPAVWRGTLGFIGL